MAYQKLIEDKIERGETLTDKERANISKLLASALQSRGITPLAVSFDPLMGGCEFN